MTNRVTGRYERTSYGGEQVSAFVPYPLPPRDPPLNFTPALLAQLQKAEKALAPLVLTTDLVPSLEWFLYAFVRKEALLSSQIEGTQATLVDLLAFEAQDQTAALAIDADIEEVCRYLDALQFARDTLKNPKGLPLSVRLLNETHARLMQGVRGADKLPGEIRQSQNWVGGSRPGNAAFVPPPPHALSDVLSSFERYIHAPDALHPLTRAGLLHVQFETIHPYLDGNGRIGRLLVMLLLEHWQVLTQPLLYLSLYFKRHNEEYCHRLNAVRTEGAWEAWLDFFFSGVAAIAREAVASAQGLSRQVAADRERLLHYKHTTVPVLRLFDLLPQQPVVTTASIVKRLSVSKPTAGRAIDVLVATGILAETTGKKRDRFWAYDSYLKILSVGTELD